MEIAILAGEASGDLHGALLARELSAREPGVRLWGFGGTAMREAGVAIERDVGELAVLGFAEVVSRLPFFLRVERELARALAARRPSVVVPIDYPGLNLRVARRARALGIPVAYYVSPQVWAWGAGRVRTIRRTVDRLIAILPFEPAFYAARGVRTDFVGHPLLDVARPSRPRDAVRRGLGVPHGVPLLGLLPGSRAQEVARHLPLFLEALERLGGRCLAGTGATPGAPRVAAAVARAPGIPRAAIDGILAARGARDGSIPVVAEDERYDLMGAADLLLVASGTATLEAACVGTPMVVVFRTSPASYALGRLLVRVPHIALANLVAGERAVPELVQREATAAAVAAEAGAILQSAERQAAMRRAFARVRECLGDPGAAGRAAEIVLSLARGGGPRGGRDAASPGGTGGGEE